ncbi:MAG: hypothetical protein A2676_02535 [Candidatus Sungbacteria bacterium RIFCSPHIGHO2_01_FULL_51_22]|uniref:Baseplate protein J-like domain-containing protein n=1 Tax=Candidatus Sungbacteria bacterium RIFCSPHIGHO2_02_FULL_51_29 TaxID=1802273 RepID=A0A1G2KUU6_9BACT|nr:MAG: hypothetical protein A2676_02535 [Candidatus Sungbacteria bacterium RIFCSPHIGHO2_01_FULL_51_22]OHA02231.1 MAG: hypothetical protein A3C16_03995 [Candidatus Sungbacteria bacterium RIFCSPHIGHO2_02_FULL_51_29]OHA06057.1 MAG: hypothetical protein A3B29_05300 [Candidatus Sungbacteria bacterium RIFCSPLOWO2_01_FULL_51_34]
MLPFGRKNKNTDVNHSDFDYLKDGKKREAVDGILPSDASHTIVVPPLRGAPAEHSVAPDFEIGDTAPGIALSSAGRGAFAGFSASKKRGAVPQPNKIDLAGSVLKKSVPEVVIPPKVLPPALKPLAAGGDSPEEPVSKSEKGHEARVTLPVQKEQTRMSLVGRLHQLKVAGAGKEEGEERGADTFSRPRRSHTPLFGSGRRVAFLATGALVVLFLFIMHVSSRAYVTIKPALSITPLPAFTVVADARTSAMNIASPRIPGLYIETAHTKKQEFPGDVEPVGGAKAAGKITVYNAFDTNPQVLLARTRFEAPDGKIFFTRSQITVPGGKRSGGSLVPGMITIEVMAEKAGPEYNISAGDFTIPGFDGSPRFKGFYGRSTEAFSGGSSETTKTASAGAIKKAQEEASSALFNDIKDDLDRKIPEGFVGLPGGRRITVTNMGSPKVGATGDIFSVEASAKGEMILVKEEDVFKLIGLMLRIKEGGEELVPKRSSLKFSSAKPNFTSFSASFVVEGEVAAAKPIDDTTLREALSGKSISEMEELLKAHSELQSYRMQVAPAWFGFWPLGFRRVQMTVEM